MTHQEYSKSIILTLFSSFFLASIGFLGKFLGKEVHLTFLLFIRFTFPLLILLLYGIYKKKLAFDKKHLKDFCIRAFFVTLSQYAFFFYLTKGTILDATLLLMTSPLFMPILTKITRHRALKMTIWLALILGFSGVILILHPTKGIMNWFGLIGLSSGFFSACSQVSFHKIVRRETIFISMFSLYFLCSIFSGIVFAIFMNKDIFFNDVQNLLTPFTLLLLTGLGFLGIFNQFVRGKAYRLVKRPADVMPFLYFSIVFSGIFDWIYEKNIPDLWSTIGTLLIVISAILTIYITKKLRTREISL